MGKVSWEAYFQKKNECVLTGQDGHPFTLNYLLLKTLTFNEKDDIILLNSSIL